MQWLASPNHNDRSAGTPIDTLVLHYTGMETADDALVRLIDPSAKVSAHYVVEEDGLIFQLVSEDRRAWHAGVAFWRGATDINGRSIGVELINPGHEFGYREFPEAQLAAVEELTRDIVRRHAIPARNVVGHSDVAPTRKMDPGELFDWPRLARAGIGLWPEEADDCPMDPEVIRGLLDDIGYDTADPVAALRAFQRHFRPDRVNGRLDFETVRLLKGLADLCAPD